MSSSSSSDGDGGGGSSGKKPNKKSWNMKRSGSGGADVKFTLYFEEWAPNQAGLLVELPEGNELTGELLLDILIGFVEDMNENASDILCKDFQPPTDLH